MNTSSATHEKLFDMETEIEPSKEFTKGFNDAYLLAMAEPVLLADISQSVNPESEYFDGFFSGKEQWELEQSKLQEKEIQDIRSRANEHGRDLERGR